MMTMAVTSPLALDQLPQLLGKPDLALNGATSDPVTRQELAVILYDQAGKPAVPNLALTFADKDSIREDAQNAVLWAVDQGLLSGKSSSLLDPQSPITRAEAAQMIMKYNALEK